MKKKEIAVNIMRKVAKNGKFTMKEEEQMKKVNDYILNFIQKETRGGKRDGAGRKVSNDKRDNDICQ